MIDDTARNNASAELSLGESSGEIAIIGMAGRFPMARNLREFWRNLRAGRDCIQHFSDEELLAEGIPAELLADPNYVKAWGWMQGVEEFDPEFFQTSAREAELTDPQIRLLLECAWETLEDAGIDPERYAGRIGTFAGAAMMHYLWQNLIPTPGLIDSVGFTQVWIVNDRDFLATRLNYKLNLRGPGMTVQSACSTSLVSVHLGVQSLLSGESDVVLAGGVCAPLKDKRGYLYTEGGTMSPDGKVRSFDKEAKGMLGGNGVGLVALKRLEDALRDGDHIRAVIKASALNNDGSDKVAYTAPSVDGQVQAISDALDLAGVEPSSISYVEAHGTGTPLGDPIEIAALSQAWGMRSEEKGWCSIGSVKSNIGHLDTAAGIAGLIKSVLQLEHRELVPSLHFEEPNPAIDFEASPFHVNVQLAAWDTARLPRRSTVSSLGMGGTNAHVILEEAPELDAEAPARAHSLVLLSARSTRALEEAATRLGEHLLENAGRLPDIAFTTQLGRKFFDQRRFVVASSATGAAVALGHKGPHGPGAFSGAGNTASAPAGGRGVAFLFSGQGSQHIHMGRGLHASEAVFRTAFERCCAILDPLLGLDLAQLIFGADADPERLAQTQFTQPALFAIEFALAELWESFGLEPAAMLGHSIGEFVAACRAGVLSLEDALRVVVERGRLMGALPAGGGMLAVHADEATLLPLLNTELCIAAYNAKALIVVAGPLGALDALAARLEQAGIASRRLQTSHAFHSAQMDPLLDSFRSFVASLELHAPTRTIISCRSARELSAAEATDPDYWVRHLREPVRFAQAIETLDAAGYLLLEVGPGQALTTLVQLQAPERGASALAPVASMRHAQKAGDDQAQLLFALGSLWSLGARIDWERFASGESRRKVSLPSYPFERRSLWIERPSQAAQATLPAERKAARLEDWFSVPSWKLLAPATHGLPATRWLVFDDGSTLVESLLEHMASAGASVTRVHAGSAFGIDEGQYTLDPEAPEDFARLIAELEGAAALPDQVLYAWARNAEQSASPRPSAKLASLRYSEQIASLRSPGQSALLRFEFYALMFLAQALAARRSLGQSISISLLSEGMYSVLGTGRVRPEARSSLGICMSINLELGGLSARAIDLEAEGVDSKLIWAELKAPFEHPVVALQSGKRWAQTFVPTPLPAAAAEGFGGLKLGGVVWISGGLGGIGLTLAAALARSHQAKLVLISRSDPATRADAALSEKLRDLEQAGAEVLVLSADVSDASSLRAALEQTLARFGALDAVIHAAGIAGAGLLELKTREQAQAVLAAKVEGTRVLREVLSGRSLDFVLLCSSISSVCAGLGQADYFAANAYLDAAAEVWRAESGLAVSAINWDAWSEVGMAKDTQVPAELQAERAAILQLGIGNAEALEACQRVLAANLAQVVVSPRPLTSRYDYRMRYEPGFARQVAATASRSDRVAAASEQRTSSAQRASSPRPELPEPYLAPRGATQAQLAAIWSDLLGLDRVGAKDNFFGLGGNSLVMMQVGVRLREQFGLALPMRDLFELITIEQLARTIDGVRLSSKAPVAGDDDGETEEFTL